MSTASAPPTWHRRLDLVYLTFFIIRTYFLPSKVLFLDWVLRLEASPQARYILVIRHTLTLNYKSRHPYYVQ